MEERQAYVRKARLGDAGAFSKLYEEYYQDLYRFALYTLKNSHDAEDAVSEAVMDAYAQIHSLRKASAFRPWIFRILVAKCKRHLKEYTAKTAPLPEELADAQRDLCEYLDVREAFFCLSGEERMILALHLFAGYSSKEIGQELHMNPNTVRSRQSRALKKMEEILTL